MKSALILLLASIAYAKWTVPEDLLQSNKQNFIKSMYTDPTTGITHLMFCRTYAENITYWQIDRNNHVVFKDHLSDPTMAGIYSAKIIGAGDGKLLYVLFMGTRNCKGLYYDQWFTESKDGGRTWSKMVKVPKDDMDDHCDRYGDSLLIIHETGRAYISYHCDCPNENPRLKYSQRPPGSSLFTKEVDIYYNQSNNHIRPSITMEYTFKNGKPIVHFFWVNYNSKERMVMHMMTDDNGLTFSEAKAISGTDSYRGFLSLNTESNRKVSSALVGTYAIFGPSPIRLFSSLNHGESFKAINGSITDQTEYSWDYRTNGMAMCGLASSPKLVMLTQTEYKTFEYSIWNVNTMSVQRFEHPFTEIRRGYGVKLSCYLNAGKITVTAVVSVQGEDQQYHLLISQDTLNVNQFVHTYPCLLYTSPSPRDATLSRMPSSA
eukprot:TRINITY_DN2964_c0_g1_i1.p1 TRINITY_DN2964_c0_g1~~TRINITY_DN2964_c0_g1_i1.p1  ORF type:complete len:433 (-),score=60.17 TRINITY_DN2964_c0_g1_i1:53-1351(-)